MEQPVPSELKWSVSFLIGAALIFLGWKVFPFLVFLHVSVCLVLIIVILLQSGEAADLAGAFGGSGSQTAFGPRGAAAYSLPRHHVVRGHVHVHLDGFGRARENHNCRRRPFQYLSSSRRRRPAAPKSTTPVLPAAPPAASHHR